ncbi:MAG: hypothetical protein HY660_13615 [Armatimonadetes bacterium]|nr:hypothetical protein [Armatimonadota bacterium]
MMAIDDLPQDHAHGSSRLGLLNFYHDQIRNQQETIDRSFRFYLLIIGLPLVIFGPEGAFVRVPAPTMAILASAFCVLGYLYFLMYVRQRINIMRSYDRMTGMEQEILKSMGVQWEARPPEPYGAAFYQGVIHMLLNTFWAVLGIYFWWETLSQPLLAPALLTTVVIAFLGAQPLIWRTVTLKKA